MSLSVASFQKFISKWTGAKKCDWDGSYGNQCVDLFRFYLKEVLKVPQFPSVKGAKYLWNVCPSTFQKIPNTLWNVPRPGDIMIYDGVFGHVDIFVKGNVLTFQSFSLNFPSEGYYDKYGNFIGTGKPKMVTHNYWKPKVIGWLRPR